MVNPPSGSDKPESARAAAKRPSVPGQRGVSDPLEADLSSAEDRIVLAEWSRRIPPVRARMPEVRLGKRWYSILWLVPIVVVGLLLGIAVCQQLRTYTSVQDFIRTYPGEGSFQPAVTAGFPLWLRILHLLNLLLMAFIIRAGIQILADHPRLNHDAGCYPGREILRLRGPVPPERMKQDPRRSAPGPPRMMRSPCPDGSACPGYATRSAWPGGGTLAATCSG
jgi:hypothetical protein